ncbi:diadenosine tetraphosphatase [Haliea atlantica]|nr:diadenosine tetraphosphatase [Haliea sp.]
MTTWAVGDIQGCLPALRCVLEKVDFQPGRDVLWSVGDVVNRGSDCLGTLRFLYAMRDSLVMVLGNHDLHLLATAAGARAMSPSDTLQVVLDAPDRDALLSWVAERPLLHREHGYTLVHAGIPPQWSVHEAAARAREVEEALRSPRRDDFLHNMYGNEPALWRDDLSGMARLRVITNYFTRMRFCTAEGELDLTSKGDSPDPRPPGAPAVGPWFSHPGRKSAGERIIFGHWAALQGKTDDPTLIGLDTGCVWGGAMTLYNLDTGERVSCDC